MVLFIGYVPFMGRKFISIKGNECNATSRITLRLSGNVGQSDRLRGMLVQSVREVFGRWLLNLWIIDKKVIDVDVHTSVVRTSEDCRQLAERIRIIFNRKRSMHGIDTVQE